MITNRTYSQEVGESVDTVYETTIAPAEEDEADYKDEDDYSDTLKQSYRSVVYDSIYAINNDKGFYYRRYIDSLMRATQALMDKQNANINRDSLEKIRRSKGSDAQQQESSDNGFLIFNSWFGFIFWILAIGLVGYIVYKLFLSNSSFFSRNRKNIISDIDVAKAPDQNDLEALLRNAIKNGNYRLAIRYLYLQTLTRLAERKLIEINANKTNYEYVNEVRKHRFANEFASLTSKYEYVWYGEYPVDEKLFGQLQDGFIQFNKNIVK